MCCDNECAPTESCEHRGGGLFFWVASWLLFPVALPVSAAAAVVAVFRGRRSGLATVRGTLLSPFVLIPVFFAFKAGADYRSGRARLHVAEPADADWTVDSRTRLPLVQGDHDLAARYAHRAYNMTARRLVRRLGPQAGTWTSPLPSPAEAARALAEGESLTDQDLKRWPEFAFYRRATQEISSGHAPGFSRGVVRPGLEVLGTGPDFMVLVNAESGREIARHGTFETDSTPSPQPR